MRLKDREPKCKREKRSSYRALFDSFLRDFLTLELRPTKPFKLESVYAEFKRWYRSAGELCLPPFSAGRRNTERRDDFCDARFEGPSGYAVEEPEGSARDDGAWQGVPERR